MSDPFRPSHLRRKQLAEAQARFDEAIAAGLANGHTYTIMANAHVRCGDPDGAQVPAPPAARASSRRYRPAMSPPRRPHRPRCRGDDAPETPRLSGASTARGTSHRAAIRLHRAAIRSESNGSARRRQPPRPFRTRPHRPPPVPARPPSPPRLPARPGPPRPHA